MTMFFYKVECCGKKTKNKNRSFNGIKLLKANLFSDKCIYYIIVLMFICSIL